MDNNDELQGPNMTQRHETLPDPQGQELTLTMHVIQSTLCHPDWDERMHQDYLVSEVGFSPEQVRESAEQIISAMIDTRRIVSQG